MTLYCVKLRGKKVFENSQAVIQFILDIAIKNAVLKISGLPISIANIVYFIDTLLSLVKAQFNVKFFSNMVLQKIISDKQFLYLVSAVLQPISKTGLSQDFFNKVFYYPSLYGLKTFNQIQAEGKSASIVIFSNSSGIVGWLFDYHFLDLQVLGWAFLNLLQHSVKLCVNLSNNFLAKMIHVFLNNNIFMENNLPCTFLSLGRYPVSSVLEPSLYYDQIHFLKRFGKRLDPKGSVPSWFVLVSKFLHGVVITSMPSSGNTMLDVSNILLSSQFSDVKSGLLEVWSNTISVFTDSFLKGLGSVDVTGGTMAFFSNISLGIGINVVGLLLFTMTELQAVVLALDPGAQVLSGFSIHDVNWVLTVAVWHLNLGILSEFMSKATAGLHSYFMKTIYGKLPITVRKRLYDKRYPGILCLHCGEIEFSDYVFTCNKKSVFHKKILFKHVLCWEFLAGFYISTPSMILKSLLLCLFDVDLYALFCKDFVLMRWFEEAV
ncbi:hypothetical protein G9A89_004309 [Geosiphon pyriformis]|nr:hypothetical protein G9A89_004309 [Geosiphon pyriformis]